jgi:ATP-dependent Lon protease
MELMEVIARMKLVEDEIVVHLVTIEDDIKAEQQIENFQRIANSCLSVGIKFSWEFDPNSAIHARHIVTNLGWKILLDRGLDVFQRYEMNDAFDLGNLIQEQRQCKTFEITFIKSR